MNTHSDPIGCDVIQLDDVIFRWSHHLPAVIDIPSLTVKTGEHLFIKGPSGCGKSTLTRAILGLEPLQNGAIRLGNTPVSPNMANAQRAGAQVVFQDPYSSFNYDREYSEYYWSRFKKAVAVARPDIILM